MQYYGKNISTFIPFYEKSILTDIKQKVGGQKGKNAMNGIFRQKSIDKVSSPEKLDEYIKVTTPGVWLALAAMIILLTGAIIWGTMGELTVHNSDGTTKNVAPISFILN